MQRLPEPNGFRSFRDMTILAHLTGSDLGLVTALFFAAALLAALGARWLERGRK